MFGTGRCEEVWSSIFWVQRRTLDANITVELHLTSVTTESRLFGGNIHFLFPRFNWITLSIFVLTWRLLHITHFSLQPITNHTHTHLTAHWPITLQYTAHTDQSDNRRY